MAAIERKTKRYPTDVTDEEWARIAPLLPKPAKRGRRPSMDLREVMNAIRYMTRTGSIRQPPPVRASARSQPQPPISHAPKYRVKSKTAQSRIATLKRSQKMKISILLPNLAGGGAERINIDLAHEFARAGHEVEFVLMQARGELLDEAQASFSVIDLATRRVRALPIALFKYLRHYRPDSILAAIWPLTVIAPVIKRISGHRCSVLVAEHNTLSIQYRDTSRVHRWVMRTSMALAYRLADCRVGVSLGVVNDMATMSGLRTSAFEVVHNPVPPRRQPSPEAISIAEDLWAAPSGARIITVGSMQAQKNYPLLLQAFAKLDRPRARLMFVGDGLGRDKLQALAYDLGIADRVVFAGFRLDPTPYYLTADLFALSSNHEGLPTVLIEALYCGLRIVSTDCPSGPSEILEGGRWGRLVPVGNADALAEAINAALCETPDSAGLRMRASAFAPEVAARRYLQLLTEFGG